MADIDKNHLDSFKKALTETTRSIAGTDEITVRFSADPPGLNGDIVRLPNLGVKSSKNAFTIARGLADGFALQTKYQNSDIFQKYLPAGYTARELYTAMENARCEALGCRQMEGVAQNITARIKNDAQKKNHGNIQEAYQATLADALTYYIHERVTGKPLPQEAKNVLNLYSDEIKSKGSKTLKGFDDALSDQVDFARLVRQLIGDFGYGDQLGNDPDDSEPESNEEPPDPDEDRPDVENEDKQEPEDSDSFDEQSFDESQEGDPSEEIDADNLELGETEEVPSDEQDVEINRTSYSEADPDYKIFTNKHDEIIKAEDLTEIEELERLRTNLDQQLEPYKGAAGRLANKLQRKLMAKQNRVWEFDREEGILDAGRLARVVANPTTPLSFKVEKDTEFRDTIVTLLLDNSGSMRGRPISLAAMCADILARTLERCQVKVEILGFTTKLWKGGNSRIEWANGERNPSPGRLNDIRHIIYKNGDTPWRRARANLGLMMKEGLLKENIDGEALEWAHSRMVNRFESRKILMVISDGAPVDDSTLSVNSSNYLEAHLRKVIAMIARKRQVELIAIGIGHDVTSYYQRAVTISEVDQLAGVMTEQLAELFEANPLPQKRSQQGNQLTFTG